MLVQSMTAEEIYGIGHSFGYYDYGEETGMSAAFSGKEATANYICAYVRGVLQGGFLHTTSEQGGGNITGDLRSKNRHQNFPAGQKLLQPAGKGGNAPQIANEDEKSHKGQKQGIVHCP